MEGRRPGRERMLDVLDDVLRPDGLFVRGGFYPEESDLVPDLEDGTSAGTLVLVGNAGPDLWHSFTAGADMTIAHPLNRWIRPKIREAAREAGADGVIFPEDGPPYPPLQDWAMRAEPVHRSPIGILIHPDFGLWHVYRAALLFRERVELPACASIASPCDSCVRRPCLTVCPADAFLPDRFDAVSCVTHVESDEGENCRLRGCMARRACPVGHKYRYLPDQQAFHTAAMVRAARGGF